MSAAELYGAALAALAYLVGAVPFGLLIARWAGAIDIRAAGSGNIGATNVARTVGRGWGVLTLVLDAVKGAAPVVVAEDGLSLPLGWTLVAGLSAILGHVFSVYLRFRGGKGVATAAGVFLALTPVAALGAVTAFVITFALTRVVGVGSMVGAITLVVVTFLLDSRPSVMVLATFVTTLILVRHSRNVSRLLDPKTSSAPRADG